MTSERPSEAAKRMRQTYDVTGDIWFKNAADEIDRMRAALAAISRTTFSGSDSSLEYLRGNQDAHETCARIARAGLRTADA